MTPQEVEILVKLRSEAQAGFERLNNQLRSMASEVKSGGSALDDMKRKMDSTATASIAAGAAIGVFAERAGEKLLGLAKETVTTAARTEGLTAVADFLGQKAGKSASEIDSLITSIKKQGITTQDSANLVIQLTRADLGLENATKLATAAQNSAFVAGKNSSEAMSLLLQGVMTLQPELIRSGGIVVSLEQEMMSYARAHKVSSDALTTHQKQQILLNAVLREAEKLNGVYDLSMQYVGKQLTSLPRYIEEAKNAIGKEYLPALGAGVTVTTEFLKVVAAAPAPFANLAASATLAAAPFLVINAASMLAIPGMAKLAQGLAGVVTQAVRLPPPLREAGTALSKTFNAEGVLVAAQSVQTAGNAAEVSAVKFRLLQQAILAVFLVPAAWDLGKAIGSAVTSLDDGIKKVEGAPGRILNTMMGPVRAFQGVFETTSTAAHGTASLGEQLRALYDATVYSGRAVYSYNEAIQILAEKAATSEEALHSLAERGIAGVNKAIESRAWKPDDLKSMMATAEWFDQIGKAAGISAAKIAGWQDEIRLVTLAGGLPELRKELAAGVLSTKEIAEAFHVSEGAVKYYEKSIKSSIETEQKHKKALDEMAGAQQQIDESTRILIVNAHEHEFSVETIAAAYRVQEATVRAVIKAQDDYESSATKTAKAVVEAIKTIDKANREAATDDMERQKKLATDRGLAIAGMLGAEKDWQAKLTEQALQGTAQRIFQIHRERDAALLSAKLQAGANTGLYEQQRVLIEQYYGREEYLLTHKRIDWEATVNGMSSALTQGFSAMITHTMGFKEATVGILRGIGQEFAKIIDDMIGGFVRNFIRKAIGYLSGNRSAFAGGMAGMLTLPSGGTGASGGSLFGMFGGGSGASGVGYGLGGVPDVSNGVPGLPGSHGNYTMAGAGIALAGGAGLFSSLSSGYTQGWTTAGKVGSAISGATTGAGIGLMAGGPVGALIGGGIGLLGGAIASMFGPSKAYKEYRAKEDQANADFAALQDQLLKTYGSMERIDLLGKQVGIDLKAAFSLGGVGGPGTAGLKGLQDMAALFTQKLQDLNAAMQQYGLTWEDLGKSSQQAYVTDWSNKLIEQTKLLEQAGATEDKTMKSMAAEYSKLYQSAKRTGTDVPEAMRPILEMLIKMGLLLDANGKKVTTLGVSFAKSSDVARGGGWAGGAFGSGHNRAGDSPNGWRPPAAAGGILATGATYTLFGEGGEAELGGPKSFFRRVLADVARDVRPSASSAQVGGASDDTLRRLIDVTQRMRPVTFNVNISTVDAAGVEQVTRTKIIPAMVQAIADNAYSAKETMKRALELTD